MLQVIETLNDTIQVIDSKIARFRYFNTHYNNLLETLKMQHEANLELKGIFVTIIIIQTYIISQSRLNTYV